LCGYRGGAGKSREESRSPPRGEKREEERNNPRSINKTNKCGWLGASWC
jgi:hypothetical protein